MNWSALFPTLHSDFFTDNNPWMPLVNVVQVSYVITPSSSIINKTTKIKLHIVRAEYHKTTKCNTKFYLLVISKTYCPQSKTNMIMSKYALAVTR